MVFFTQDLPQICLSLDAETLLMGWGKELRVANEAELDSSLPRFFVTDFFLQEPHPWRQFSEHRYISWKELASTPPLPIPIDGKILGKKRFEEAFEYLKNAFSKTSWKKAVPYAIWHSLTLPPAHFLDTCLKRAQPFSSSRYFYAYCCGKSGFLGLTPEILFTKNEKTPKILSTMALAGTTHGSSFTEISDKLQKEHRWTVQGIREALSPLGSVTEGSCSLLSLGALQHLYTPLQLDSKMPLGFTQCVLALHPTPALGVYPKEVGLAWLKAYDQKLPRHCFGAPIGCIDPATGRSVCYVAIRQIAWGDFGLRLFAGCGITEESDLREEWEEILLKFQSIRSLFFSE